MAKRFSIRDLFRILLGGMLVFAGIGHLSYARTEFQAQVPDWVPLGKDLVVVLSGFAEISLGALLIFWKKRRLFMGWVAAFFFAAVFPGNWHQYKDQIDAFTLDTDQKRLIRLFFQPVLMIWALWSTGVLFNKNNKSTTREK